MVTVNEANKEYAKDIEKVLEIFKDRPNMVAINLAAAIMVDLLKVEEIVRKDENLGVRYLEGFLERYKKIDTSKLKEGVEEGLKKDG